VSSAYITIFLLSELRWVVKSQEPINQYKSHLLVFFVEDDVPYTKSTRGIRESGTRGGSVMDENAPIDKSLVTRFGKITATYSLCSTKGPFFYKNPNPHIYPSLLYIA
jgi:hypothetical protein